MQKRVIVHEHRFGYDLYPFQTVEGPIDTELLPAIAGKLGIDFEPDREEHLTLIDFRKEEFPIVDLKQLEEANA